MAVNVLDDVKGGRTPDASKLKEVSRLAQQLLEAERAVEELEERLKTAKEKVIELKQRQLPDTMQELGLKSFSLHTGEAVVIEPFFRCSLAGKAGIAAIAWLKETKQDGMITRELSIAFGKGEEPRAIALRDALVKRGYTPVLAESVNTGSFKALIKEVIKKGDKPPLEDLGVFMGKEAIITPPKKS